MAHAHNRRGQFGPWSFLGGVGPGSPPWNHSWSGHGPGSRAPKARRGDVRAAILGVLADEPMNGYQIIQKIAELSNGAWKPSPGSVYPTLQQLEDEGLVRVQESSGRRSFHLTDDGHSYVTENADEIASPWETRSPSAEPDDDDYELRPLLGQVAAAMWQVLATGTPDQQAKARDALADMRRRLYGILADDDGEGSRR